MNKYLKFLLTVLGVFCVFYFAMIIISLYGMEIEDHYGGLQEIYYKTTDSDIIINETTKEFGIVDKGWRKIYLTTPTDENDELFNFAYKSGNNFKLKIYRLNNPLPEIKQLNYEKVIKFIDNDKSKLIIEYKND